MTEFDQVGTDDANLRAGLGDLAGLVSGSRSLSESLSEVAGFAGRAIPGADGVGVALLRHSRRGTCAQCVTGATGGAISVYALDKNAFDERAVELGELLALRRRCVARTPAHSLAPRCSVRGVGNPASPE